MDVYLPINGKAVRFVVSGEQLGPERLARLRSFKMPKALIRSEDEPLYRTFLDACLNEAEQNSKIPLADRAQALSAGAENAAQDLADKPADKGTYQASVREFERFGNFLKSYEGSAIETLKLPRRASDDTLFHSGQVAALSLMLAEQSGLLSSPERRRSLMTGCFLHDVLLEQNSVPRSSPDKLTPEEKKIWNEHPAEAARLFGDKDHVDALTVEIILQHEEVPSGVGFPRSLKASEMNPLAVIVSAANRYDFFAAKTGGVHSAAVKEFATAEIGRYDLALVQKIQAIFTKLA